MKLLYIIGEPGAGKTTLVKHLTRKVPSEVRTWPYVSWTHYTDKLAQLGYDRGTFGGTDALGMAAQKHVLGWIGLGGTTVNKSYEYVLAEGDRLANGKFFEAVKEAEVELTVVLLQASPAVLEARRSARNALIGKSQDARWLKTRETKVRNLRPWVEDEWVLDAELPVAQLAQELYRHPVAREFLRLRKKARAKL